VQKSIRPRCQTGTIPSKRWRQAGIEARNKKMETLDALAGAYKASPGFLSKRIRTQEFYESCLRVHILPRLGTRSVKEIGRKDIASFLDRTYNEASGPASNSARWTLSVLFSYAAELELIDFNPVSAVKQRHRVGQRTRQLNDTELKCLWQALHDLEGVTADVSDMIRLCLFLPARVNEIAGMEWAELNFDERLWIVRADRMKNNKPHELPFGEFCQKLLEKRRNSEVGNNPWGFPANSGIEPMNGKVASRACNRLSRDWGWQPSGPNALRRGFTTRMAENGVRLEILERALSHDVTDGRAIAHYDHYSYRDEKRHLIEHWEEALLKIVQEQDSQVDQTESDE